MLLNEVIIKIENEADKKIITKIGNLFGYRLNATVDGSLHTVRSFIKTNSAINGTNLDEMSRFADLITPHASAYMQ